MVANKLQKQKNSEIVTGAKHFNAVLATKLVKTKINQMVGAVNAQRFSTSLISLVNNNPSLAECESSSIITGALQGEALHLPISLGYFYLVPFMDNKLGYKKAQFILGYKGLIQLAIKTGQYIDIDAIEIREGEYLGRDSETGKPKFKFIEDDEVRENTPVIGYMAYFEMRNGYKKKIYWPKSKMLNHADQFSQAFSKNETTINTKYGAKKKVSYEDYKKGNYDHKNEWMYSSFWYKNFDEMAKKTVIRQLLSKHGLLTDTEIQAYSSDGNSFEFSADNSTIVPTAVVEVPEEAPKAIEQESSAPKAPQEDSDKELAEMGINVELNEFGFEEDYDDPFGL